MSTYMAKAGDIKHAWFVIDATDKVVGRSFIDISRFAGQQVSDGIAAPDQTALRDASSGDQDLPVLDDV